MLRLLVCPLALLLLMPVLAAAEGAQVSTSDAVVPRQVQTAVERLQSWYDSNTGLWKTTGWWNSANALTALIDYSRVSGSRKYEPVIERTYAANIHHGLAAHAQAGFLNQYYDDEGWWALAWIDAYDLTGNENYLSTAQSIFVDMTGGWDDKCGGGLWWRKKRDYKNAIANELFLSVAAHLANRTSDEAKKRAYATWAQREWKWFRHSGMIEHDHLISDGLDSGCKDNHRTKWSYNQGVILGGLAELSHLNHGGGALREARRIADAAITELADDQGILHDRCEPKCSGDATQFKGIFVRNLGLLNQRTPQDRYRQFILLNAESILKNDQGPNHSLGSVWFGPPEKADASTQSSAIDALVAALQLNAGASDGRK